MQRIRIVGVSVCASVLVTLVACGGGSPQGSTYKAGDNSADNGFGGSNTGGANGLGGAGSGGGTSAPDDLKACATSTQTAQSAPVYLAFLFDQSGSMVQNNSPKWDSSKAATEAFFSSPDSKGISASLTFFPSNPFFYCDVSDYENPQVPMTALPSPTFAQVLDKQDPDGGTPTLAALQGVIDNLKAAPPKDGKQAIVLVTDGLPDGCDNNTVDSVSKLVASVAQNIPTYVIGVGTELDNLNTIAAAGGTKTALVVSDTNPTQIQSDFEKAIATIKKSALTCDYAIPAPPNGEQLDTQKVNVVYSDTAGNKTLPYNQACTGGTGWRYDDPAHPTHILLCDGSCDQIKIVSTSVDVLFGCKTQTSSVK